MGQAAEGMRNLELLRAITQDLFEVRRRLETEYESVSERRNLLGMLDALRDQERAVLEGRPLLSAAASSRDRDQGGQPA
jgi:hypothetical protein